MRIMKLRTFTMSICILSLALINYGCGSSSRESASQSGSFLFGGVATVGDTACFQCHGSNADPLTGETFVTQYQRSLHAELGCESCHGGGAQHNGIGPFPFTLTSETPDAQKAVRCAMCHNGFTVLNGKVAPLSSSLNFQNGNHANPFSAEEAHEAKCARCHSHEGAILYGKDGFTGDASILNNSSYQPVLARDPETFNTIKCGTCHEHGGNIRQTKTRDTAGNIVTWDPNGNKVTDQFDLCTSCHSMSTNEGKLIGSGAILQVYTSNSLTSGATGFKNVSTAAYYHNTRWFRTLPSTHYDQPASRTTASGTIIEGYVIRKNTTVNPNPCYDCHGHEFKANTRALVDRPERGSTVFTDWAQSAHAGKIMQAKLGAAAGKSGTAQVDAVMTAGVRDTSSKNSGWGHYNWDDTASRGTCQRCHTATGASNFMKSPSTYDTTGNGNSFNHLSGWNKTGGSPQQELLYCWGCHSNPGAAKLYKPGARTETYAAATAGSPPATVSYPDIQGSNVCMTCHVGREIGQTIKNDIDADGVRGFINSHYLTAGAQLFGQSGYTYAGRNYTAPVFFAHNKIGTAAAPGTGSNGPCVGCHMSTPNKHKFTNVSSSASGLTITSTACATCHTGGRALTGASLATEEEEYQAALTALDATLQSKNIFFFKDANPYFFTAPYVSGGTNTSYTNWAGPYGVTVWRDVMGAAFNLNLLAHDPGGYAHNRFYAKRLIWDSIDFIDNGVLDNTVPATLIARLTGQTLIDAQTYLGATRP